MHLKKSDWFLLIFLVIIVIITFLSANYPNVGDVFTVSNWFKSESLGNITFWEATWFTIIACFIGAIIPIPIPYAIPVTIFSAFWIESEPEPFLPILALILFATLSNTLGDLLDYIIGKGAEKVMSKEDPQIQNRWGEIILNKPKAIPGIIVLFGVTPLPDSLLLVPLGLVNYSMKKTIIWMYVGKFFMMLLYALAGIYGLEWFINLLEGDSSGNGWISGVILLYLVWIIMAVMMKYKPKEQDSEPK